MSEVPPPGVMHLPGYDVVRRIGRGGFAVVWEAVQLSLARRVAIKILMADLETEADARRFNRERDLLTRLSEHRYVVDVHDAGISPEGRPFIVMRLYPRGSLTQAVADRGPLPLVDVVGIASRVAQALDFAHGLRVIHRDITPGNILITDDGDPALADFGIATLAEPGSTTATFAFTRSHAAPEVIRANDYSVASDVYSLASTTFFLLAARDPFPAENHGVAGKDGPIPPVGRDDVPPEVQAVLARGMATDPLERYGSAGEFAAALTAATGSPRTGEKRTTSGSQTAAHNSAIEQDTVRKAPVKKAPGETPVQSRRHRGTVPVVVTLLAITVILAGSVIGWARSGYVVRATGARVVIDHGFGPESFRSRSTTPVPLTLVPVADRQRLDEGIHNRSMAQARTLVAALTARASQCAGVITARCQTDRYLAPKPGIEVGAFPKGDEITIRWGTIDPRTTVRTELLIDDRPATLPCPPRPVVTDDCTVRVAYGRAHTVEIRVSGLAGVPTAHRLTTTPTLLAPAVAVTPGTPFTDGAQQYCPVNIAVQHFEPKRGYNGKVSYSSASKDAISFRTDSTGAFTGSGPRSFQPGKAAGWAQVAIEGVKTPRSPWVC